MNYCIYKLEFLAPLHTGHGDGAVSLTNAAMTLRADTVFSAVCNEAGRLFGSDTVNRVIGLCSEGRLLFSDTFPYCGDVLYIPKPIFRLDDGVEFDVENRKSIKSVEWLPASEKSLDLFYKYIHSGKMFDTEGFCKSFARSVIHTKASLRNDTENAMPYRVAMYEFFDECGLYGIFGYEDESDGDLIKRIFSAMSYSGIGGFVSSGCGRFSFVTVSEKNACAKFIMDRLAAASDKYMLLTSSLPREDELESALGGSYYSVIRRGGFSFSAQAAASVKKKTQYFLASGSVLCSRFAGDVYKVGENGKHSVYRYSKPMFMEVKL